MKLLLIENTRNERYILEKVIQYKITNITFNMFKTYLTLKHSLSFFFSSSFFFSIGLPIIVLEKNNSKYKITNIWYSIY